MKKTKSGSCTIATADIGDHPGDGEVFCRGAAAGRVGRGGEAVAPEAQVVPRYRAMSLAWLAQPRRAPAPARRRTYPRPAPSSHTLTHAHTRQWQGPAREPERRDGHRRSTQARRRGRGPVGGGASHGNPARQSRAAAARCRQSARRDRRCPRLRALGRPRAARDAGDRPPLRSSAPARPRRLAKRAFAPACGVSHPMP